MEENIIQNMNKQIGDLASKIDAIKTTAERADVISKLNNFVRKRN